MSAVLLAFACFVPSPLPSAAALQGQENGTESPPLSSIPGAVDAACAWLVGHQDEDGHWDCAGFMKHDASAASGSGLGDDEFWRRALDGADEDPSPPVSVGAGEARHDVGVTALALLALMADGHSSEAGDYAAQAGRGLAWLLAQQNPDTGLFGKAEGAAFHYGHAIATLALANSLQAGSPSAASQAALQHAVRYIEAARNPYGAWRYDYPPVGDNDTSVTVWMLLALRAAEAVGVEVDESAVDGATEWLMSMRDPATGRVGYVERGSRSSRVPGMNDFQPQEGAETLTAGALFARLQGGANPREDETLVLQVRLALDALGASATTRVQDAIWIDWGTQAMAELGSLPWARWSQVVAPLLLRTQESSGAAQGSWPAVGAWGYSMGRVGTTALLTHALATVEGTGVAEEVEAPEVAEALSVQDSVGLGLDWLAREQAADGRWGSPKAEHDIGVSALALLALLSEPTDTIDEAQSRQKSLARGFTWLLAQQDSDTGLFGEPVGHTFIYDHALASLAVTEALVITQDALLREPAQRAVNYIARARNPYGVWRYSVPPVGENDTSITAWMVQALRSAQDAGLKIDAESWTAARQWLDEMTDEATGRVGYTERGSRSARVPGANVDYPTDLYEALTAAGLYTRFLAGEARSGLTPVMLRHADLVAATAGAMRDREVPLDLYALYFGSRAMYQMGGDYWSEWSKALRAAAVETQRQDGAVRGSWDPSGPWGYAGGRVYATAVMVLNAAMVAQDERLKR